MIADPICSGLALARGDLRQEPFGVSGLVRTLNDRLSLPSASAAAERRAEHAIIVIMALDQTAQRLEALTAAIQWTWAFVMQAERLEAHQALIIEATMSGVTVAGTDRTSLETYFLPLNTDRHFLFIAGRQVIRSLDRMQMGTVLDQRHSTLMKVLRDCFEHWDEQQTAHDREKGKGEAYRRLREIYPEGEPNSHSFTTSETHVGGLPIHEMKARISELHERLIRIETSSWAYKGGELPK